MQGLSIPHWQGPKTLTGQLWVGVGETQGERGQSCVIKWGSTLGTWGNNSQVKGISKNLNRKEHLAKSETDIKREHSLTSVHKIELEVSDSGKSQGFDETRYII